MLHTDRHWSVFRLVVADVGSVRPFDATRAREDSGADSGLPPAGRLARKAGAEKPAGWVWGDGAQANSHRDRERRSRVLDRGGASTGVTAFCKHIKLMNGP